MTKLERRIFTLSNLLVSIIGLVYFIYKYFFKNETEFGLRPHEYTSTFLHLHIITVPILLICFGYLLSKHIIPKLTKGNSQRKLSGISLLVLFFLMTLSGYLLQMAFENTQYVEISHLGFSFIWIFIYLWHFRMKI